MSQTHTEYLAYLKAWRAKNPEYMRTYMKEYRKKNGDRIREFDRGRGKLRTSEQRRREWLKEKYNLTVGEYLEMAEALNHTCPICLKVCAKSEKPKSGLHVDHDHATGFVRGLLCGPCNRKMGQFGDDPDKVEQFAMRAIAYLRGE